MYRKSPIYQFLKILDTRIIFYYLKTLISPWQNLPLLFINLILLAWQNFFYLLTLPRNRCSLHLFFICPTFWGMFILVWIICGLICFSNFVCNISYFSIKSWHWAFQKLKHSQAWPFHFLNCFASFFPHDTSWALIGYLPWIMKKKKQKNKTNHVDFYAWF